MKKRLLAMLLLVVMVLSMAACGEKVDPTDAPKATDALRLPTHPMLPLRQNPWSV